MNFRHDKKGRSTNEAASRRVREHIGPPKDGGWIWLPVELLQSTAWRSASLSVRKLIDELWLEHNAHNRLENGRLRKTYDQLEAAGIARASIAKAIADAVALGLVRKTKSGQRGAGDLPGFASEFRLTFIGTIGTDEAPATNEWKAVSARLDEEAAKAHQDAANQPLQGESYKEFRKQPGDFAKRRKSA